MPTSRTQLRRKTGTATPSIHVTRRAPFGRLIYPLPEEGGLGVHLTLDLAGTARFGPDVEWLGEGAPDFAV